MHAPLLRLDPQACPKWPIVLRCGWIARCGGGGQWLIDPRQLVREQGANERFLTLALEGPLRWLHEALVLETSLRPSGSPSAILLEVDDQLVSLRLFHGQVGWFGTLVDAESGLPMPRL
jgi:hypothetical protein